MAQYASNYSNNVDVQDAAKLGTTNESLAIQRNGSLLSIERRQLISVTDTLFFNLRYTIARKYQFEFTADQLDHPCLSGFLEDSYTNLKTPFDLNGITSVTFTVDASAASKAVDRFRIIFKPGIVWTGAVNTDWYNTGNWLGDIAPSTTCGDALIPNTSNKPVINSGIATVKNLTIQSGASLTVDNATLQVGAVITNAGTLKVDNGTIEMNGIIAQTIATKTFQNNAVKNLIISNTSSSGVILIDTVNLYGTLSFGNHNNQKLVSSGHLNLRSTVAGTARVADISNNGINTGNVVQGDVIVERYYPARRAWRLITAPVSTKRSIFNSWQVGGGNTTDAMKPAPLNSGTYVTSLTGGNGLDQSLHYSLDSFKISTGQFIGINNTILTKLSDSTVNPGTTMDNRGYFIFVRGDRTPKNLDPPFANITTLRDTGALQTYTKTFSKNLTSSNLFMLVGNPFASPVDFSKLTRSSNLPRKFWAWDPRLNSTLGAYVIVDGQVGKFVVTPSPDPAPSGTISQDSIIQSGQAFFVQSSAPGLASITFNENNKSVVDNNTVFRPLASAKTSGTYESLRANLYLIDPDTSILADGVFIQFNDDFSANVDGYDAPKFTNFLENLGILLNSKTLSLERRPVLRTNDTVFFKLWNTTARNYQFRFNSNIDHPGLEGFLEDRYLKTSIPFNLNGYTNINFSITNDTSSKAVNRFYIIFRSLVQSPLPVTFTSIKANKQGNNINIEWTVENELNMKEYKLERSGDGIHFSKIGITAALRNNEIKASYTSPDASPLNGVNYYRIACISRGGEIKYSSIVDVTIGKGEPEMVVYPNPLQNGLINLQMINQPKGNYYIRLLNKLGQVLMTRQSDHNEDGSTETIQLHNHVITPGIYQLEITGPVGNKTIINIVY